MVRKRGSFKAKLTQFNNYIIVAKTYEKCSELQIMEMLFAV